MYYRYTYKTHIYKYIDGKFFCSRNKVEETEEKERKKIEIFLIMSAQRHTACYQVIARLVNCTQENLWLICKTSYFNDILYTVNSGSENMEFLISFGL